MAERDRTSDFPHDFALPYRPGEFVEVATRLQRVVTALEEQHVTGLVPEELRFAAAALTRAEALLAGRATAPAPQPVPSEDAESAGAAVRQTPKEATPALEIGQRGEWRGRVGRQPEFQRLENGRLRAVFYLAQHPDPADPEHTEWIRCYNLDRYAEALRKKGRLAGAEILVRGAFQGERTVTYKNRPARQQKTVYCYGVRVLTPPRDPAQS